MLYEYNYPEKKGRLNITHTQNQVEYLCWVIDFLVLNWIHIPWQ